MLLFLFRSCKLLAELRRLGCQKAVNNEMQLVPGAGLLWLKECLKIYPDKTVSIDGMLTWLRR